MRFFMTELTVKSLDTSMAWYQALGFEVNTYDAPNCFALLTDGNGGRLALKQGAPKPGGCLLHFQVAKLPPGDVKTSPEGYQRVIIEDPDGHTVCLFEWTKTSSKTAALK